MSFIIGDEIVTEEVPVEIEPILGRMKENTREKAKVLMNTIAMNDRFLAYVIPNAGMVVFADELTDDHKIFRLLISNNGELYIDNKQKGGDMLCPLFDKLEEQIRKLTQREAETTADDREYKRYDKFMPKIVDTINQVLTTKSEIFN